MSLAKKPRERGQVLKTEITPFLSMPIDELRYHLDSPEPPIRTCAATALGNYKEQIVVAALCQQLKNEFTCNSVCN